MEVYFVAKNTLPNLLFKGLNINSTQEMVGACLVTFFATVMFEAMKLLKLYLSMRRNENPLDGIKNLHSQESVDTSTTRDNAILLSSLRFPATVRQIRLQKTLLHVLNTVTHMVNFFYGYLLMLLVMTYNVWLTLAVVIGSAVGYFIFGAFGQTLQVRFKLLHSSQRSNDGRDQCHESGESPDCVSGHL